MLLAADPAFAAVGLLGMMVLWAEGLWPDFDDNEWDDDDNDDVSDGSNTADEIDGDAIIHLVAAAFAYLFGNESGEESAGD
jgi:hypothetical protein